MQTYFLQYGPILLLGLIKPAKYVFRATWKSHVDALITDNNTEIIMIHALDYDIYLKSIHIPVKSTNTIVFLDQNLPFHSDHIIHQASNIPTPEEYFPQMCTAFDEIERVYNARVIISCHPRSNKDEFYDYYGGREVIIGNTNDLVKKSMFCIAHYSASINYAVMYSKPIIFITTDTIEKSSLAYKIHDCAEYFRKSTINVSNNFSLNKSKDLCFDNSVYKQYMNDFIKSESSNDGLFWSVVAEKIKLL